MASTWFVIMKKLRIISQRKSRLNRLKGMTCRKLPRINDIQSIAKGKQNCPTNCDYFHPARIEVI